MVDYLLLIPILASFFVTLFLMPKWIKRARRAGIVGEDMNKTGKTEVVESGGIIVVLGFIIGVLGFVAYRVFYLETTNSFLIDILALLSVSLILGCVGFIDDILGWKMGLNKKSRLILVALAAIPLMAINAGKSIVSLPFIGQMDLGILYPLILIPIGIVGATITFNFLAGFNGLEAGQGILILSGIGLVTFFMGNSWLSVIALCMVGALFAFLFYNFYPARVFPGDSLTYTVGGLIAIMAILGNFERVAIFFFIPYIIETGLKLRGKLRKESFGNPREDDSLELRYNKIYGLEHLAILLLKKNNIKPTEKKVVYLIWLFQIVIIILGFIIFREGIFI